MWSKICCYHVCNILIGSQVATALIRLSLVLDVDAPKRAAWQTLYDNLAQYPLEPYGGVDILAEVRFFCLDDNICASHEAYQRASGTFTGSRSIWD